MKDLKAAETSCLCAVLRQAARSAAQLYDLVLEPTGLRATQFYMLKVIAEAGEIPQWKFAREHAVAVETLSRRFATLRRRKLIACPNREQSWRADLQPDKRGYGGFHPRCSLLGARTIAVKADPGPASE